MKCPILIPPDMMSPTIMFIVEIVCFILRHKLDITAGHQVVILVVPFKAVFPTAV